MCSMSLQMRPGSSAAQRPPRVVVLYNRTEHLDKGEPADIVADRGVELCAQAVIETLCEAHLETAVVPISGDVERALSAYPPLEWVIYNLGEGYEGRLFEEARIAWALEAIGYRYTGAEASALALTTHKARAKAVLARAGLPTPDWRVFCHPDLVTPERTPPAFPLIVKPVAEDASMGITASAVVHTPAELRARVAYVVERYRQAALVETFVEGREISVPVWGNPPALLPASEVSFPGVEDPCMRMVPFEAKWQPGSYGWEHSPVTCPAQVSQPLAERIGDVALRAWQAIGGSGYGRIDMRVDCHDVPYVLEVNCNPDISPDAGFFRSAQAAGYSFSQMVLHILGMVVDLSSLPIACSPEEAPSVLPIADGAVVDSLGA